MYEGELQQMLLSRRVSILTNGQDTMQAAQQAPSIRIQGEAPRLATNFNSQQHSLNQSRVGTGTVRQDCQSNQTMPSFIGSGSKPNRACQSSLDHATMQAMVPLVPEIMAQHQ